MHAGDETAFTQDYKQIAKRLDVPGHLTGDDLLVAVWDRIDRLGMYVLVLNDADDLYLFSVRQNRLSRAR